MPSLAPVGSSMPNTCRANRTSAAIAAALESPTAGKGNVSADPWHGQSDGVSHGDTRRRSPPARERARRGGVAMPRKRRHSMPNGLGASPVYRYRPVSKCLAGANHQPMPYDTYLCPLRATNTPPVLPVNPRKRVLRLTNRNARHRSAPRHRWLNCEDRPTTSTGRERPRAQYQSPPTPPYAARR